MPLPNSDTGDLIKPGQRIKFKFMKAGSICSISHTWSIRSTSHNLHVTAEHPKPEPDLIRFSLSYCKMCLNNTSNLHILQYTISIHVVIKKKRDYSYKLQAYLFSKNCSPTVSLSWRFYCSVSLLKLVERGADSVFYTDCTVCCCWIVSFSDLQWISKTSMQVIQHLSNAVSTQTGTCIIVFIGIIRLCLINR